MDENKNLECAAIREYIELVENGQYPVCVEQVQLIELVKKALSEPGVYIDEEQLEKYLSYQKYFPFELFPWEKFLLALHLCAYTADGFPRFSVEFDYVGRGSGKNGKLGFENLVHLMLGMRGNTINKEIYDYFSIEELFRSSSMASFLPFYA